MKKSLTRLTKAMALVTALGTSHLAYATKNPFENADFYINPIFKKKIDTFLGVNPDFQAKAKKQELLDNSGGWNMSTAIWLDKIATIKPTAGDLGVYKHLENAYMQAKVTGHPIAITFVVYDLPNRDCAANSSNGEIIIAKGSDGSKELTKYKNEFIQPITDNIKTFFQQNPEANNLIRIILVLEPDSLPNMLTNAHPGGEGKCDIVYDHHIYEEGIKYAISSFANTPNTYMYLDIAHSGWLGWGDNANKIATIYNKESLGDDFTKIRGFITNTANYTPVEEYFSYADYLNGIIKSKFYSWNNAYSEASYIGEILAIDQNGKINQDSSHRVTSDANGLYKNMHFLIDTSRNGWKAAKVEGDSGVPAYERYEQRHDRGNWCNIENIKVIDETRGAGLGAHPIANPVVKNPMSNGSAILTLPIDAYVWIKPPGESDGYYHAGEGGDIMCGDENHDALQSDGGLPAPHAGDFFDDAFKALIDFTPSKK